MQIPQWLIFVALETLLVLVFILVAIGLYVRHLRALIRDQLSSLKEAVERSRQPATPPEPAPTTQTPQAYLEQQRQFSLERFAEIAPGADPEQAADQPPEARLAALRSALLELELQTPEQTPWDPSQWDAFQARCEQWRPPGEGGDSEELKQTLATAQKRIENLEKFKKLFFEMESQWENARAQAQDYHDQLAAMADEVADQDKFDDLLEQYHSVYDEIGDSINTASEEHTRTVTVTRADPRTAEELDKLRTVAADQHRIISKLQKRLADAETAEQKEQIIGDLQQQLDQQLRYVKESETCVELLERELSTATEKLVEYEQQLEGQGAQDQEVDAMRSTLEQFTLESKDLIKRLENLEDENDRLRSSGGDNEALEREYRELQSQYAQLEERYLALKMGE